MRYSGFLEQNSDGCVASLRGFLYNSVVHEGELPWFVSRVG
jgi:hypothetical protein